MAAGQEERQSLLKSIPVRQEVQVVEELEQVSQGGVQPTQL